MSDNANPTEKIQLSIEEIEDVVFELKKISNAFYITGNTDMSVHLHNIASRLLCAKDNIESAEKESLDMRYKKVTNIIGNALDAALTVGEREIAKEPLVGPGDLYNNNGSVF